MSEQLPRAILLDLDDTILALSASAEMCWRRVCEAFALRIPELGVDELFTAVRASGARFWQDPERHRRGRFDLQGSRRQVVADAFRELGINQPGLAAEMAGAYGAEREQALWPLEGAVEALSQFRQKGVRLGLITNGEASSQRRKIERFGLAQYFDVIVIEGEFGVGKPHESVYIHALRELGSEPGEAWMAGDDLEWDVAAPQRLGIFAVWVNTRGEELPGDIPVRPDRVVGSLAELAGLEPP